MALNHYPRHVGDITQATFGLSLAEFGAYNRLLDAYYSNEAPLPLDAKERYRMAGAVSKADRTAVDYVVFHYFSEKADGWHQKRADHELMTYRERGECARQNGAQGGRPRNQEVTDPVISENQKVTQPKANQEPVTSNQVKAKTKAPLRGTPIPEDFRISPQVAAWNTFGDLTPYLETFIGRHRANGRHYIDWDAAFKNAIREDWYGLRKVTPITAALGRAASASAIFGERSGPNETDITAEAVRIG